MVFGNIIWEKLSSRTDHKVRRDPIQHTEMSPAAQQAKHCHPEGFIPEGSHVIEKRSFVLAVLRMTLCVLMVAFSINAANAACSNPPGVEGEQIYNSTYKVMQYCDGTHWTAMRGNLSGLSCSNGQIAKWNGSSWACASDNAGSGGSDNLGNHSATTHLNMNNRRIRNLSTPSSGTDAANRSYVDTQINVLESQKVNKSGDTMTGALTLSGAPVANAHAATKEYVDTVAASSGGETYQVSCSLNSAAVVCVRINKSTGESDCRLNTNVNSNSWINCRRGGPW